MMQKNGQAFLAFCLVFCWRFREMPMSMLLQRLLVTVMAALLFRLNLRSAVLIYNPKIQRPH